ncbi:MAG: N-acetylmuramoyl-L-alanine amidase [Cyanophyceae cyanobacterium]
MKIRWLVLSCLSLFLYCSPAKAGRLLFWRFEEGDNRLVFSTDEGVQPRAQLIFNPTRLVIDLPGTTLGKPTVRETMEGIVRSIRVGQFDEQTTRLVVELAPGYTLDPEEVRFRGVTPTQWTVDLPTPEQEEESSLPKQESSIQTASTVAVAPVAAGADIVQVTRSGLLIRVGGDRSGTIEGERSRDRRQMSFDLEGVTLPDNLVSQAFSVAAYGVSSLEFAQTSSSPPAARVTLNVDEDSPDWQATFSRLGGLVLFPEGGTRAVGGPRDFVSSSPSDDPPTVVAAELAEDDTELVIRSEGAVQAQGSWDANNETYQVTIPNAELDRSFAGPEFESNSPISKLVVRAEEEQVVLLVQPALGIQVQALNLTGEKLSLQLQPLRTAAAPPPASIVVPQPEKPASSVAVPPPETTSVPTAPSTPTSQVLVTLDPGHGGKDPGTIGINGVQEKNVILPISLMVKQFLEKQGVRVQMTRDSDYFVSLEGRAQLANRAGADLFVSIHANAINLSRPDVNGLETYYYQSGQRLAQTIHRNVLQSVSVRDRRVRQARFYVLRKSLMPAVLVETGFLTGREDAVNLQNDSYRRQMAEAIARGILEYIRQNNL